MSNGYEKFVEDKKRGLLALTTLDDDKLLGGEHEKNEELLISLGCLMISSFAERYEEVMNVFLVDCTKVKILLEEVIPGVLVKLILDYANFPRQAASCWACCDGGLFIELRCKKFDEPEEVRYREDTEVLVCILCESRYPRETVYGKELHRWQQKKIVRSPSFRVVRHHSVVIPPEYKRSKYDAASGYNTLVYCSYCAKQVPMSVKVKTNFSDHQQAFYDCHDWKCPTCLTTGHLVGDIY